MSDMHYQTKAVTCKAVQWDGENWVKFGFITRHFEHYTLENGDKIIVVNIGEGRYAVPVNYWLISDANGDLHILEDSVFKLLFEKIIPTTEEKL